MIGTAHVIRADARHLPIASDSVDLVITSPPYYGLRSYQDNGSHYTGQIGSEPTPTDYLTNLLDVTRECIRVLKISGSMWINLGDRYATGNSGDRNNGFNIRHGNAPGRQTQERSQLRSTRAHGIPTKSLVGLPWRYALACIDDLGLTLRAELIWSKPNGLPESVTDRVRRSHEQWFHFTLSPRYFSAVDEIREEFRAEHKVRGREPNSGFPGKDRHPSTDHRSPLGKLPGSVWEVATEPLRAPDHLGIDHYAAFPTEWPKRIIRGWSPAGVCRECGEGRRPIGDRESETLSKTGGHITAVPDKPDGREGTRKALRVSITDYVCACPQPTAPTTPAVILDPFGGTGTTALVAKALGRTGITVDMSADYCRYAQWRTNDRNELAHALDLPRLPTPDSEQLALFP
jgi:DNA modification methylase